MQHESAKYDDALDAFKRARVILEKLVEDHPQLPQYRLYLSKTLRGLAEAHLKRDEPQLALDALLVAHPHAKWLMENHPQYPEVPEELDTVDRWIAHLR